MALYAFDGTGNEDKDGDTKDSNVLWFFRGYGDPLRNDDTKKDRGSLYLKGIGTRAKEFLGKTVGEIFGLGGHKRVREALDRMERNFDAGDEIIDVVGFSRGAALAISFANEIAGKYANRAVRFIGVWDIVGEFGLPGEHVNAGHNLHFPPNVEHCYHAMALDEHRALFQLTRLSTGGPNEADRLQEVWFRGVHSDVGGGNGNLGLNWIALNWMFENALREGLPISGEAVALNLKDKQLPQMVSAKIEVGLPRAIRKTDLLHSSVRLEPGEQGKTHNNPPANLARIDDQGTITGAALA
jgi:uncharacterized protein (DUF2235 family)